MAEERSELHNKRYPEIFSEARERSIAAAIGVVPMG
jgi:hypothetical protein